ncbi:hypothetical protein A2U01_0093620, partial [Trifolium medium]|nr:hypothetical protein [Trifolium medium]
MSFSSLCTGSDFGADFLRLCSAGAACCLCVSAQASCGAEWLVLRSCSGYSHHVRLS